MTTPASRLGIPVALLSLLAIAQPVSAAEKTRSELKTYFETGDVPTGDQFRTLIDSFINYNDDGLTISGIAYDPGTGAATRKLEGMVEDGTDFFAAIGTPGEIIPPMAPEFGGHAGFLGLRLGDALGNAYFGYLQLSMDDPLVNPLPGIHVDYFAFETTPGAPITMTSVPAPGALALFASACTLLVTRRRKR